MHDIGIFPLHEIYGNKWIIIQFIYFELCYGSDFCRMTMVFVFSIYELSKWYEDSKLFPIVKNYNQWSNLIIYLTAMKNNNKTLSFWHSQFSLNIIYWVSILIVNLRDWIRVSYLLSLCTFQILWDHLWS